MIPEEPPPKAGADERGCAPCPAVTPTDLTTLGGWGRRIRPQSHGPCLASRRASLPACRAGSGSPAPDRLAPGLMETIKPGGARNDGGVTEVPRRAAGTSDPARARREGRAGIRHDAPAPKTASFSAAKDTCLTNLPLHELDQNRIWQAVVALACEITAWTQRLAFTEHPARRWEPKRLRLRAVLPTRPDRPPRPPSRAAPTRPRTMGRADPRRPHPSARPRRPRLSTTPPSQDPGTPTGHVEPGAHPSDLGRPVTPNRQNAASFPPHQADLALATFLLKVLDPRFFVRDRPNRASPRATKKAGDFPARKDRPSVVRVTRRLQIHCLQPRRAP